MVIGSGSLESCKIALKIMQTIQQTKTFEVGQIAYCNGGCTMQLPTFYKVVRRTDKTVWLQEIANQLIEHDGYGQKGRKIPVDIPRGGVFNKRVKNWKDAKYGGGKDQEFAYIKYWGIVEPWDGTAKYYDSMD